MKWPCWHTEPSVASRSLSRGAAPGPRHRTHRSLRPRGGDHHEEVSHHDERLTLTEAASRPLTLLGAREEGLLPASTNSSAADLPGTCGLAASLTRVSARRRCQRVREEFAGPLSSTPSLSRTRRWAQLPQQVAVSSPRADQRESRAMRQFRDRGPIDFAR